MTAIISSDITYETGIRCVWLFNNSYIKEAQSPPSWAEGEPCLYLQGKGSEHWWFIVPEWLLAEFRGGNSIEPVIDWLIENHGHAEPWLYTFMTQEGPTNG